MEEDMAMAMATPTIIHLEAIHPITQEEDIAVMGAMEAAMEAMEAAMEAMEDLMEDLMEDSLEELPMADRGAIRDILDQIGIIK